MMLFLAAAGLTLIFGVLKILNFAHGGFFMLGVYLTYTLLGGQSVSAIVFFGAVLSGGVIVALLGIAVERLVISRLYHLDESYMLIATYALLLILQGLVEGVWGIHNYMLAPPQGLNRGIEILGVIIPVYSLVISAWGVGIAIVLALLIYRTSIGKLIRAAAADSAMTNALGINVTALYTLVFAGGAFLAALGGGVGAPNQAISIELANTYIVQAFGVVVVGGLGNIGGAFLAAVVLGLIDSFGTVYLPQVPGLVFYLAMAIMLIFKPQGLLASGQR